MLENFTRCSWFNLKEYNLNLINIQYFASNKFSKNNFKKYVKVEPKGLRRSKFGKET
jgi:hypothetical protein